MRVFACLAATLDGKIASQRFPKERFGSQTDLEHLLNTRNQADAILSGGETFRQFASVRRGTNNKRVPIQCIVTRQFNLDPNANLFKKMQDDPSIQVLVFSPEPASDEIKSRYPKQVEWITTGVNSVSTVLETLKHKGVKTLSIEGGGQIVHLFLKAQALQEFYLTLCPLFLGGTTDPALVAGEGFRIVDAPRTQVLSADWKEQELYLHLKIDYPEG